MTDMGRKNELQEAELERRLEILEGPRADEMLQDDLPVSDLVWLLVVGVVVSALLLWWAL